MWLFHSVQLRDLSPECFRHRLINYCFDPKVEQVNFDPSKVFPDVRVEPFDSLFEQRVFLRIVERGFRVIPQFNVAGFRIDLVVEGMNGRLAVECDGDAWHGAAEYERDLSRQRQLERSNWTFWRVRESSFNRDSESALSGLWSTLERNGIIPWTAAAASPACDEQVIEVEGVTRVLSAPASKEDEGEALAPSNALEQTLDSLTFDESYATYDATAPDPRRAESRDVMDALQKIILVEGPVVVRRLFKSYLRAAGIGKLGRQIEDDLSRSLDKLIRRGDVEREPTAKRIDRLDWVVKPKGAPSVRVRSAGGRSLEEIPQSELAALMARLRQRGNTDVFRRTLSAYGYQRMTTNARAVLESAEALIPHQMNAAPSGRDVDRMPTPSYDDEPEQIH